MKWIINADDFGYCKGVNLGIVEAYKNGILTSTTLMTGMPGVNHAIDLLKENKGLGCGIHMTLTAYEPILKTHKTIVDENGNFYKNFDLINIEDLDLEEVYNEFCTQIEKAKDLGVEITHLDSHHHVHTQDALKPVIKRIKEKYKLPLRGELKLDANFYAENVSIDYLKSIYNETDEVVEIMCHPAYLDSYLYESSSYSLNRVKELKIITSNEMKNFIKEKNIELCNYNDIF